GLEWMKRRIAAGVFRRPLRRHPDLRARPARAGEPDRRARDRGRRQYHDAAAPGPGAYGRRVQQPGRSLRRRPRMIDPITFEVLRHRLATILDEGAAVMRNVSGSP